MFCKYCGAQLKDNSKFCASCGAKLESDSSSARTVRSNTAYANAAHANAPHSNPHHSNAAIPNAAVPNAAVPNAAVPLGKKKRTFNIGNFVIWAGCVIAFISLFLPFASASFLGFSQSVSLFDTEDGIFFIVTIVATALLNFTRLNLLPTIGSAVMVFFLFLEVNSLNDAGSLVNYGPGRVFLIIGTILMIGGSIGAIVLNILRKKSL